MHLGPVIATAMAAAALAAAGARCETFDDFSSNTLDTSRWEHLGGQVHFAMRDGRLEFPCVAGATDRLTARLAVVPGFYVLEFTDYASTSMALAGVGQGSYVGIGLAHGDERVRTVRGDIRRGGYFESNHFVCTQHTVHYSNSDARSGRLGARWDGVRISSHFAIGNGDESRWQAVGPIVNVKWNDRPQLQLSASAGASGCTRAAIKRIAWWPEPRPDDLVQRLAR